MTGIEAFIKGSPMGAADDPPFNKDGRPSVHAHGVLYQGPWSEEADGFNEHVRRSARALAMTGCPVHLRGFGPHVYYGAPRDLPKEIAALLTASIGRYSVLIHQLVADAAGFQGLTFHRRLTLEENAMVNRFKIVYSVWERDRVSKEIVGALNRVGQVWVACKANRNMLAESGVEKEKIRVVPVPHFADDPLLALRGRQRKPGPVRFYHIGKIEPRKAQDQIVLAFLRAFKSREAHLVLKCSPLRETLPDYPIDANSIVQDSLEDRIVRLNGWTRENVGASIEVIDKRLSPEQMVALHRFGDVYVTMSRGEGFDMPAYDAKLAGNLMVYTPSGGPQDFAGHEDVLVPASGQKPCHSFYRWEFDACYLDYDPDEAVEAFRVAHGLVLAGMRETKDLSEFQAERVGEVMMNNVMELVSQ